MKGDKIKKRKNSLPDQFTKFEVNVPVSTKTDLLFLADKHGVGVGRLVAYAIDNEMGRDNAFEYPKYETDLPEAMGDHLFAKECKRVVDEVRASPNGTGIDSLVLLRRNMKLSKLEVLQGIAELLANDMLELYKPAPGSITYRHYGKKYRKLRLVNMVLDRLGLSADKQKKYVAVEGESMKGKHMIRGSGDRDDQAES